MTAPDERPRGSVLEADASTDAGAPALSTPAPSASPGSDGIPGGGDQEEDVAAGGGASSTQVQADAAPAAHTPLARQVRIAKWIGGVILLLYVLTFARGLAWQWRGIITARPASVPVLAEGPRGVAVVPGVAAGVGGAVPRAAGAPAAKAPLPPTDEPPPRSATDKYGVTYDEDGVAVMGIDTDPGGVYNVPPGRQVRIGGPSGPLFDVTADGKLAPASAVHSVR